MEEYLKLVLPLLTGIALTLVTQWVTSRLQHAKTVRDKLLELYADLGGAAIDDYNLGREFEAVLAHWQRPTSKEELARINSARHDLRLVMARAFWKIRTLERDEVLREIAKKLVVELPTANTANWPAEEFAERSKRYQAKLMEYSRLIDLLTTAIREKHAA